MKGLNEITLGLLLICGLASCNQTKTVETQSKASTYPLLTLTTQNRTLSTSYSTVLEGRQFVEVRPQVGGIVTDVLVKEGADVRKGQTLFIIDTIPYAAAYAQAKAGVASAEAQAATAKLRLEGKEDLFKENVISDFELQTARHAYLSAEAALELAKAQAINAANNLSFAKVKSPVNGCAGMTSIRVGALVGPSSPQPLINVADNAKIYAYFSLSEKEVLRLMKEYGSIQKTLEAYPEVSLQLNDGSIYPYTGKIDVISGIVDKSVVRLRAVFDNPERLLLSGSSANIIIPYEKNDCLVIPQGATYEIQDKVFAFKVIDGKASSTLIEVFGINDGKEYIVESGLEEGDVIVAEGAGLLRDGTPVAAAEVK